MRGVDSAVQFSRKSDVVAGPEMSGIIFTKNLADSKCNMSSAHHSVAVLVQVHSAEKTERES